MSEIEEQKIHYLFISEYEYPTDNFPCELYKFYCKDSVGLMSYMKLAVERFGLENLSYSWEFNHIPHSFNQYSLEAYNFNEHHWMRVVKTQEARYKSADEYLQTIKLKSLKDYQNKNFCAEQWPDFFGGSGRNRNIPLDEPVSLPITQVLDELFIIHHLENGRFNAALHYLPYFDKSDPNGVQIQTFKRISAEIAEYYEVIYLGDFIAPNRDIEYKPFDLSPFGIPEEVSINWCYEKPVVEFIKTKTANDPKIIAKMEERGQERKAMLRKVRYKKDGLPF